MALTNGTRLGPYEIVGAIGAGGMGEVYRARDTRLDRTVAIKVLPAAFAADPQLRERFDREARSISALDHPNICAVYDVGHEHGIDFIVMAFVEGETLGARLERGPLKLPDVLRHAMEIASALDKAHRAGIVHRDVKPGNVMLTPSGAKLLDFGLAKITQPTAIGGLTGLPTTPPELTAAGTILGTFQYMAPEQLEGTEADARTDIFAFGGVLYEMATGRKAFDGKSRASLISAILRDDPPPIVSTLPGSRVASSTGGSGARTTAAGAVDALASGLDRVVRRCLAKRPEDRWQTVSDLLEALRWVRDGGGGGEVVAVAQSSRSRIREPIAWAIALVVAAVAAWLWFRPQPAPAVVRLSVAPPREDVLNAFGVAFAPDGSGIVFPAVHAGTARLYRRRLDQLEAVPIRGTDGAEFPFFSPDGKWVAFFASNTIRKVPVDGGPPSTLTRTEGFRRGATWGINDTIVYATDTSPDLMSIPAAGGQPTVFVPAKLFSGTPLRWPSWRRDGSAIVFTVWSGALEAARVGAYSIKSGQAHVVIDGTSPRSLASDLMFARGGSLWTVPMDWKNLTATGAAVPVLEGLTLNIGGAAMYSVADDGSLAYVPGSSLSNRLVAWMTRDGQRQPLLDKPQTYTNPRLSPDGRRVAVQVSSTDAEDDIWLYDIVTKVLSRLTFGGGRHTNPVWTPDGRRVIYSSGKASDGARNLYWIAADGTGEIERLTDSSSTQIPSDVSPDGRTLSFGQQNEQGRTVLWTLPLVGDRKPRVYLESAAALRADAGSSNANARFSPDGRWIAYQSSETGPLEVYVRPFPGPGGKWQVSTGGGISPVWSPTGKELFFVTSGAIMAVDVQTGASFSHGVPHQLFTYNSPGFSDYSVTADGRRFLLLVSAVADTRPEVLVALNWLDELKRRTASSR